MAKSVVKRKKIISETKSNKKSSFGWDIGAFLNRKVLSTKPRSADASVLVCGVSKSPNQIKKAIKGLVSTDQLKRFKEGRVSQKFVSEDGRFLWVVQAQLNSPSFLRRNNSVNASAYGKLRDSVGALFSEVEREHCQKLIVSFDGVTDHEKLGFLVGCEIAAYSYKRALKDEVTHLNIYFDDASKTLIKEAAKIGGGVNLARHLVNMPPNVLFPESYAAKVVDLFSSYSSVKVQVWDEKKLQKENMNLHLAVGGASQFGPRLVRISYRPGKSKSKSKPTVLVGKGITFDSGGLDLKSAAGMRLMKKDMGGSAAIVGALYALVESGYSEPLDVYLPLAENAVSSKSFRPGDVIQSRSGKSVEIHNTDAEGRLVLADALSLAAESAEPPKAVINVATLTGAVKVGLGVEIGGYFSNDDALAEKVNSSSKEVGDLMWEMPLYEGYRSQLKTQVAEINHCGSGGYGGALTAALFLYDFVAECPFVHFDIYGWNDQAKGAYRESGGSGQAVQCLIHLIRNL